MLLPVTFASEATQLLVALSLYAFFVSPLIPREFGGTSKPVVMVWLQHREGMAHAAELSGVPHDGARLGPVALLIESDTRVVVAPIVSFHFFSPLPRGALGIERDRIAAIAYEGPAVATETMAHEGAAPATPRARSPAAAFPHFPEVQAK
jgi:hypothetical protein